MRFFITAYGFVMGPFDSEAVADAEAALLMADSRYLDEAKILTIHEELVDGQYRLASIWNASGKVS